jgi:hypothetical protein
LTPAFGRERPETAIMADHHPDRRDPYPASSRHSRA